MKSRICPEIGKEELEKLAKEMTDAQIAKMLDTKPYCITYLRLKYGIRKYGTMEETINKKIAELFNENCFITSFDFEKKKIRGKMVYLIVKELEKRGYIVVRIRTLRSRTQRIMNTPFPRVIVYSPDCISKVAEFLSDLMYRRASVRMSKQVLNSFMTRNKFPEDLKEKILEFWPYYYSEMRAITI